MLVDEKQHLIVLVDDNLEVDLIDEQLLELILLDDEDELLHVEMIDIIIVVDDFDDIDYIDIDDEELDIRVVIVYLAE